MEEAIFNYLQDQLPQYKILNKLGKGAYGIVFKIKRKTDSKYFALKTMELQKMNQKTIRNTLNEIRILCSLNNQFVCGYEEAFTVDNGKLLCIIMEYVGGGDMFSKVESCKKNNYRINEDSIWKYLCQILLGLKSLHDLKIIHRDIKSANLLLTEDFEVVKLADMGIAKIAKQDFAETQVGTPYYLAPEIWQKNTYDYRCDIFSLGCVVYEMATLNVPFQGDSLQALYKSIKRGLIKRIPSTYSSDLYGLIKLMLKRNPHKRPSTYDLIQHPLIQEKIRELNLENFQQDQKKIGELMETIVMPSQLFKLNTVLKNQKKRERTKSCGNFHNEVEIKKLQELQKQQQSKTLNQKNNNPPLKKRNTKKDDLESDQQINYHKQDSQKHQIFQDSKLIQQNTQLKKYLQRASSKPPKKNKQKLKFFNFV